MNQKNEDLKVGWWGAFLNLFRPEPDMVSLESEVKRLRGEVAHLESECSGKILVDRSELLALREGIRHVNKQFRAIEERLNRLSADEPIVPCSPEVIESNIVSDDDF
jgi:hypothetical protein